MIVTGDIPADSLDPGNASARILESVQDGETVVEVVLIDAPGLVAGSRLLVWEDRMQGTLGDADLDHAAVDAAREKLQSPTAETVELQYDSGSARIYIESHRSPDELVIVGAGHIAQPLCDIGSLLGFRVIVLDDRPEFATRERFPEAAAVRPARFPDPFDDTDIGAGTHLVLITRGHKYDYEALLDVLRRSTKPAYIGMVGSRRRVRATFEQLVQEGIPRERLDWVNAPIGLDIEAQTPAEIAVSIAAELVRVRRGGSGRSLKEVERVVERWL